MTEAGRTRLARPVGRRLIGWLMAFLLAGCTISVAPPSAPTITPMGIPSSTVEPFSATPTPSHAQMLARLQPTASLPDAAHQCAALIGRTGDAARVRVETLKEQECMPCNKLPIGSTDRGIPAGEVAWPPEDSSWVWITVDELLCIYLYARQELKPSSVTRW